MGLAVGVLLSAALLLAVPGLAWSWTELLGTAGSNVVVGQVSPSTAPDPHWVFAVAPWVYPFLLLLALPRLVVIEERLFRRGVERSAWRRWVMPMAFGVSHALVGIPLAGVVSLAGAGVVFQRRYLATLRVHGRGLAVLDVAALHLAYNVVLIALVGTGLALVAVAG